MNSDRRKRSRPPEEPAEIELPAVTDEIIEAYATALAALAEALPLPLLSVVDRGGRRPGATPDRDARDSVGALCFAPQVVRRTGVTPEALQEALSRRAALVQLRDTALRVALGAGDGLRDLEGDPGGRPSLALLDRAVRGEEVDAVLLSQAVAAQRTQAP